VLRCGYVSAATCVLLIACVAQPFHALRAWALLLLPGLPVAMAIRRHYRLTELAGVTVAASLIVLSASAAAAIAVGAFPVLAPAMVVGLCAMATIASWRKRTRVSMGPADAGAALTCLLILPLILAVYATNGPQPAADGERFVMRHWMLRDGAYLFGLTQEAVERQAMPAETPFAAGVPAHYATFGHCGLAVLAAASARPAPLALWWMGPVFHVAALFLLYHAIARQLRLPARSRMLWAAAGLVAIFAWRADFYVYLQSQSVALVVLAAFLWCTSQREWWRRSQMTAIAFIIALWLGAAHTVSGGAAVAVLAGTAVGDWRWFFTRHRIRGVVWICGLLLVAWVTLQAGSTPLRPRLGSPGPAAWRDLWENMGPFAPLNAAAIAAIAVACRHRRHVEASCVAALCVLSLGYSAYGLMCTDWFPRFFAIFNAQRFVYFSLPFVTALLLERGASMRLVAIVVLGGGLVANPPPVLRQTPLLVWDRSIVYTADDLKAYDAVRRQTPATARFITNAEHWGLPAFTGRCEFAHRLTSLFALHALPDEELQELIGLRSAFFSSAAPQAVWPRIRQLGIDHVLVEEAAKPPARSFVERLKSEDFAGGSFREEFSTSASVVFRWIPGSHTGSREH